MLVLFTFLFSVFSAFAYQVTFPSATQGWNTTGPNYLEWQRVDSDPLNFTVILVNANNNYTEILDSLIDGTTGSTICSAPSGGWVAGSDYRVNLDQAFQSNSILAQSGDFNITAVSSSSTTSSPTTTSTASGTSSSTTPTKTSAATLHADARASFSTVVVVLTVLAFTLF